MRIIKLYKYLKNECNEHVLFTQFLRSGTSIGANSAEAQHASSRNDFINKLSIALKEANETKYWLEILFMSDYLRKKEYDSIISD